MYLAKQCSELCSALCLHAKSPWSLKDSMCAVAQFHTPFILPAYFRAGFLQHFVSVGWISFQLIAQSSVHSIVIGFWIVSNSPMDLWQSEN